MDNIGAALKQPEYIHVLLNPLPGYGLLIAIFVLVISVFMRSKDGRLIGLILIAFAALIAVPTSYFGHQAYDALHATLDETATQWANVHAQRANQFTYVLYGAGVVAVLAIFLPRKFPRAEKLLLWLTLILALAASWSVGLIARAGGEIRHSEFRTAPPPSAAEHGHDHDAQHHSDEHGDEK